MAGASLDAAVAEAVKVCSDKQLAVMIAKGIDRFPDNADRVSGHLDIWWIIRILVNTRFRLSVFHSSRLIHRRFVRAGND